MNKDFWIKDLNNVHPGGKYSQYGEEAYLNHIFANIGTTNKYFVDIGANDGQHLSNTRSFYDSGWTGLMLDSEFDTHPVKQHFVTVENINAILKDNDTPAEFDLLSIDIDGNDYWVLQEVLTRYKPRVIISEFNSEFEPEASKAIIYDPKHTFNFDNHYSYTYQAGLKLAAKFGYRIIFQNSNLNLYYVHKDCLEFPDQEIDINIIKFRWWGEPKEDVNKLSTNDDGWETI